MGRADKRLIDTMRLLLAALTLFASVAFGAPVTPFSGGTGVANPNTSLITVAGPFTTVGNFLTTLTITAPTAITLPTSGTLLSTTNPINVGANAITGGAGSFTTLATSGVTTHSAPVNIATGVDTTGTSPLTVTKTWNNAGVAFPGVTWAFTDTASSAASNLFNISSGAAGTTSRFAIDKTGSFTFSGNGPHGIGAAPTAVFSLNISGTFTGTTTNAAMFGVNGTVTGPPNSNLFGSSKGTVIAGAASGTHSIATVMAAGGSTFTTAGAAITDASTLRLTGIVAPAGTANASTVFIQNQSSGATINKALWVRSGTTSLDGSLTLPLLATSSAATTGTLCWTTGTGNVNVNTTLACLASSAKYKRDIRDLDIGLPQVMALRPISYELKPEYNGAGLGRMVGLVAEEVAKVDPRLVQISDDGKGVDGVRYMQLGALLAKAIQDQQAQIESLAQRIRTLESAANDAAYRRTSLQGAAQ